MASVFKPAGASKYVISYTDENGRRRKKAGATDKAVSERIGRDIENRIALRREGVIDAKTDALVTHEARPLADHLADWRVGILARGKTARHADQYHTRAGPGGRVVAWRPPGRHRPAGEEARGPHRAARTLADALKAARLSDLAPDRIQAALARLRQAGKSNQTVNHHRAAVRAFVRWCGDNGRLRDNPMRGVKGFNVAEDPRHPRRALTPDEAVRLIQAAERGRVVRRMTGPDRARLYDLALGSGVPGRRTGQPDPRAVRPGRRPAHRDGFGRLHEERQGSGSTPPRRAGRPPGPLACHAAPRPPNLRPHAHEDGRTDPGGGITAASGPMPVASAQMRKLHLPSASRRVKLTTLYGFPSSLALRIGIKIFPPIRVI